MKLELKGIGFTGRVAASRPLAVAGARDVPCTSNRPRAHAKPHEGGSKVDPEIIAQLGASRDVVQFAPCVSSAAGR